LHDFFVDHPERLELVRLEWSSKHKATETRGEVAGATFPRRRGRATHRALEILAERERHRLGPQHDVLDLTRGEVSRVGGVGEGVTNVGRSQQEVVDRGRHAELGHDVGEGLLDLEG
jgi:hypothetical protein